MSQPIKLVCFPHAGGNSSFFAKWQNIHPNIELTRIVLPGRETRRKEQAKTIMADMLEDVVGQLELLVNEPYVLFGHSMGSAIAYEVALHFESIGKGPEHLFVSGRRAPHLPARRRPVYDLAENDFLNAMYSLNGTPEAVMQESSLMELFLPCLRADFELIETYQPNLKRRVNCSVTAMCGDSDPEVNCSELAAWKQLTNGQFKSQVFIGDHFYLRNAESDVFSKIRNDLSLR
nr:thioesterase domain-containing protein [Endozoicomonas sp. G2_1]